MIVRMRVDRRPRETLSGEEARRVALRAQGFGAGRVAGAVGAGDVVRVARRLGLVQIDSVNVLVRSHYLPCYSRLGAYDPAPTLASLRIPVLMIYGEKDRLIPARQSAAVARQAFSRNRRARVVTIPSAGHGMRLVVTREALRGQPPGPLTWAPTYWPTVTDWLARNVRCSRPA